MTDDERRAATVARYLEKHREEKLARDAAYRAANSDKRAKEVKIWRRNNAGYVKAANDAYNNSEAGRERRRTYLERKRRGGRR